MKIQLKTTQEVKDILSSKIFAIQHKGSYLFEDDTYAILPGNISLFMHRSDIVWSHIKPKHKYSILRDGSVFIFETYNHELYPNENEFIISIYDNEDQTYTVILTSKEHKLERLRLLSE